MKYFLSILSIAIILAACSTDVELNAPYKSTTVVYGLLDPIADTQWVKINKTFIGEGNNLEYALVRDSSEYDWSEFKELKVQEIVAGEVVAEFPLLEKEISNKSINGVFYGPLQTVYYFVKGSELDQDATYKIIIDFYNRTDVYATTEIVPQNNIAFFGLYQDQGSTIRLAEKVTDFSFNWKTAALQFNPDDNAPFYEVILRCYYTENQWTDATHTTLVSSTDKSFDYLVGSYTLDNKNTSGRIPIDISGESFFAFFANQLNDGDEYTYEIGKYNPDALPEAATETFDLLINVGGEELYTYYQVNSPVTGIVQERPTYTNISNGLGLFSSRSVAGITGIPIVNTNPGQIPNTGNLIALKYSEYTSPFEFCDPGFSDTSILEHCD
ncbi:MAG: DUF4249 family protein [Flavobacteriales bacterium]